MKVPDPTTKKLAERLREQHKADYPDCTYGDRPHFVPPSFGQIGFFMCAPPTDLTNHTRCRAPFDHDHQDHCGWF